MSVIDESGLTGYGPVTRHDKGIPELEAQIATLTATTEKLKADYNKFFNLHHTLAVQEAGIKGILCDALKIEHYEHSLYELSQEVTATIAQLQKEISTLKVVNVSSSGVKTITVSDMLDDNEALSNTIAQQQADMRVLAEALLRSHTQVIDRRDWDGDGSTIPCPCGACTIARKVMGVTP